MEQCYQVHVFDVFAWGCGTWLMERLSHSWSLQTTWSCHLNFLKSGMPPNDAKNSIFEKEKPRWIASRHGFNYTGRLGIASKKTIKSGIDPATELATWWVHVLNAAIMCNHRFSKWRCKFSPLCCSVNLNHGIYHGQQKNMCLTV